LVSKRKVPGNAVSSWSGGGREKLVNKTVSRRVRKKGSIFGGKKSMRVHG